VADLKRWFKCWTSILEDPAHTNLSLEDAGRWVRLGAMTALVGEGGTLVITRPARRLCQVLEVASLEEAFAVIKRLPNVHVEEGQSVNDACVVTWKNWSKYQVDSTVPERVKRLRRKRREEEIRGDKKRKDSSPVSPPLLSDALKSQRPWPSPEALVELYNANAPDECPEVTKLSVARAKKARAYLAQFPERKFWEEVCGQIHGSRFLRGLRPGSDGHSAFIADLDWLLTKGKDGTENCVKVYEGKYHD
jgi:hypothetical protein